MASEEEREFITRSTDAAANVLNRARDEDRRVTIPYNAFIREMARRGYAREVASSSLSILGMGFTSSSQIVEV